MAIAWTVFVLAGLLAPAALLPFALPEWLPWPRGVEKPSLLDKQIHFVLFLVETLLLLRPGVVGTVRRAIAIALALAVGTELLQGLIPTRTADVGDLVANLIGVGIAVYVARIALGAQRKNTIGSGQ